MLIRKKILPRTLSDFLSLTFLLIIIPLIYWFELWIVLPEIHGYGSNAYVMHFCFGTFIMINIVGNFTYAVLCDSSIRQIIIPTSQANFKDGWRICSICESLAPPRSWHCTTCKTCILKRDHHCIFTACCIGYKNHRYFFMFIFYLFISTLYAFIYNNYFIWSRIEFEFPMTVLKLVFPVAMFTFGFDDSIDQFYLLLYIVTLIGMLFTGVLCTYHFNLVLKGCTSNENNKSIFIYSVGWKKNIIEVFGNKWYLVWILPYISSNLPQDGVTWVKSTTFNKNSIKCK